MLREKKALFYGFDLIFSFDALTYFKFKISALVAQRIEQLPSKQRVVGSNPSWGTIFRMQRNLQPCRLQVLFLSSTFP